MHIGHVLAYAADCYGGPPRVARELGERLSEYAQRVSLWSTVNEDEKAVLSVDQDYHLHDRVWPRGWFRSPGLADDLSRNVQHIDVLHIHEVWSYPQYIAARLARNSNTPYIVTPHGVLEPWRVRRKGLLKFCKKRAYLKLAGISMLEHSVCLHALNTAEIDGFRRIGYRGPVTVVPNGVDVQAFNDLPDPEEGDTFWPRLRGRRVVLFLSRLSSEKGLDQLLPVWGELVRRGSYDDAVLVLAGPDDRGYGQNVKRLIDKQGIGDYVLLTGMVTGHRKQALISRADIYTLPSHSEGFSVSILENMAAAKPVLITPGCNFPEVAAFGAGLCVPCERESLREAVATLLDMPAGERTAMGRRARELIIREYSWDVVARKMMTIYACAAQGRDVPMHPQAEQAFACPAHNVHSRVPF